MPSLHSVVAPFTYGIKPIEGLTELDYMRLAFSNRLPFEKTGLNRMELFYRIADLTLPGYFNRHEWTDRVIWPLCYEKWCGFTGCSNSAKTHNIIGFAVNWWLCAPEMSSVIIVSTTRGQLKRRAWAEVQACFKLACPPGSPPVGNLVESDLVWQSQYGDVKHAIFGKAVEEGPIQKVADDIKGHHTDRQMLIIDEATSVSEAIFLAHENLYSFPEEWIMAVIGNMTSWLDPMGRFCEPDKGVSSVSPADDEWETRPKTDGTKGVCIHFDARRSPNIKAGRTIDRYIPTRESIAASPEFEGTPSWYANIVGFPSPEGNMATIYSEPALEKGGAFNKPEPFLGHNVVKVGGFDPAYTVGGDTPSLRFGVLGPIDGDKSIVALDPPLKIRIRVGEAQEKITFQLASEIRRLADARGVPSQNMAIDDTMPGLCDILEQQWGPIIRVIGGEKAQEDRTVSNEDIRKCSERYANLITQLWFDGMHLVHAGQIRGLDRETARGLCVRLYDGGEGRVKRAIEGKRVFKKRVGRSPDEEDALMLCLHAALRRGLTIGKLGRTVTIIQSAEQQGEAWDKINEDANYQYAEEFEEMGDQQFI